jgi:hypothetical protein
MSFRIVEYVLQVGRLDHERNGADPNFQEHIASSGIGALAALIIQSKSVRHEVHIPNRPEDLMKPIRHVFRLGFEAKGEEMDARLADMAAARQQGYSEAMNLLSNRANAYSLEAGGCGRVIAGALDDVRATLATYR